MIQVTPNSEDGGKVCYHCNVEKSEFEFPCGRKGDEFYPRHSSCRECISASGKIWADAHKPEIALYNKLHRKARNRKGKAVKKAITDKIRSGPCIDCKNSFPIICMDFDHVKGVKIANISKMVDSNLYTVSDLLEEISKCELVCSNCHRIRTQANGWGLAHKNREQQSLLSAGAN